MKLTPILLIGAATGGVAGYLAATLAGPAETSEPGLSVENPLESKLAAALVRIDQLEAAGREARLDPGASPDRQAVDQPLDMEELFSTFLDDRLDAALAERLAAAGAMGALGAGNYASVDEAIAALQGAGDDWEAQIAVMQAASDAGLLDSMIEELERRTEAQPDSEGAHLELAMGYLQKIFDSGNSPESGLWAGKLDKTYDRALEINDTSWNARFGKAVSLSNWPAFLGKQNEAIRQFEILREQQSVSPDKGGFAETYLYLGNLYQQTGQADKARGVWEEGSSRFPEHSGLQGQLNPDGD